MTAAVREPDQQAADGEVPFGLTLATPVAAGDVVRIPVPQFDPARQMSVVAETDAPFITHPVMKSTETSTTQSGADSQTWPDYPQDPVD